MKVLVNFTECISDNHQGGSGKIFNRKTIIEYDGSAIFASDLFDTIRRRLIQNYSPIYDEHDRNLLRVNSVEIFE